MSAANSSATSTAPAPLHDGPLSPVAQRAFDYSDLDHWMVQADRAIQRTRRALDQVANFRAADANGLLDVDR